VIVNELDPGTRRLDPRALMLIGIVVAVAVILYWSFTAR
jgi:preprotein translocase subunit Sec61beta